MRVTSPAASHIAAQRSLGAFAYALAGAIAVAAGASSAGGQTASHRIPHKYLASAIGAGIGAALSAITRSGSGGNGACSSSRCVTLTSMTAGGLIGFLIGSEQDKLNTLRYRGGRPLALRLTSASLKGEAVAIAATDVLVGAGGTNGVELFRSAPGELKPTGVRGATLRGIAAVALDATTGALTVGTAGGAYIYPPGAAPGALVLEQEVTATVAASGHAYVAAGSRVVTMPAGADSVGRWPSIDAGATVRSLAHDAAGATLWAGTDSGIVAFATRGDLLVRVGVMSTGAAVRRVSVDAGRLAAALGDSGVRLFDVADPAAPRSIAAWHGERFAYDVSLVGTRAFVASGLDGVTVLDASGGPLRVLGLARDAGFAVAVTSHGGYTYVLDRTSNALRRFDSTSPMP